jgi:hypothetical protein
MMREGRRSHRGHKPGGGKTLDQFGDHRFVS